MAGLVVSGTQVSRSEPAPSSPGAQLGMGGTAGVQFSKAKRGLSFPGKWLRAGDVCQVPTLALG